MMLLTKPHDHPLAQEKQITLEQLAQESLILPDPSSPMREAVERLFAKYKIPLQVKLELGNNEAIKEAIALGLGISIVSLHAIGLNELKTSFTLLNVKHFPIPLRIYTPESPKKSLPILMFFHGGGWVLGILESCDRKQKPIAIA
ncbi:MULTISPECIES: LysR substrate-binding domain-containing protein [Spirulina sp. CCY15215]|uniref:LysR substrate-binding domain-containing protein n=1 Tax=Spirulina sp. CCY15215 TaxID=2767591 RepID=UPI00194FBBF1|nr:LysR substrate-binding domain-containing protein [Spirulina major]